MSNSVSSQVSSSISSPVSVPRPRPILMIPLRRCGSHALRLRLNFNTEFYSPYPLHIVDLMPLVPLYGDLSDDNNYFRMVVDVIGLQTTLMVKWPDMAFNPVEIFEAIYHLPRSVHRIVWELLLRAGEKHHARVVMDKSLDSVHYADELMQLFPDMLFLNVVRDPRAQVASMNRAIIHDFDSMLNAKTWVRAHQAADAIVLRYPERVLTIRYEDFLGNQEQVLRQVCAFFGIAYLPAMLDVSGSQEAQQITQMSALWASNSSPPIPANVDKFKRQLSAEEINIIETLTRPYMEKYGYEMMTEANAIITDAENEKARQASLTSKQNAWKTLEETHFQDYFLRRVRLDYLERLAQRLSH